MSGFTKHSELAIAISEVLYPDPPLEDPQPRVNLNGDSRPARVLSPAAQAAIHRIYRYQDEFVLRTVDRRQR